MNFWEFLERNLETIIVGLVIFGLLAVFPLIMIFGGFSDDGAQQHDCLKQGGSWVVVKSTDGNSNLGYNCIKP